MLKAQTSLHLYFCSYFPNPLFRMWSIHRKYWHLHVLSNTDALVWGEIQYAVYKSNKSGISLEIFLSHSPCWKNSDRWHICVPRNTQLSLFLAGDRLSDVRVLVSSTLSDFKTHDLTGDQCGYIADHAPVLEFTCATNTRGRYVKVVLGGTTNQVLTICEVEVFVEI